MPIDHLSFASRDLGATRRFYEGQLGFLVLIHEWMLKQEGGRVDYMFIRLRRWLRSGLHAVDRCARCPG